MKISVAGLTEFGGIQQQFLEEGNSVNVWFSSDVYLKIDSLFGDNFMGQLNIVNGKVENLFKGNPDFVFVEYNNVSVSNSFLTNEEFMNILYKKSKEKNIPVIGLCMKDMLRLEYDRMYGKKIAEKIGFSIPKVEKAKYKDLPKVMGGYFSNKKCLIKVNGDKQLTTIASAVPIRNKREFEVVYENDLFEWKKNEITDFIVEEFIEGIELEFGLFWNGKSFLPILFLIQEYKGAQHYDTGNIHTGEVGTIVYPLPFSKLSDRIINLINNYEKVLKTLRGSKQYKGLINLNTIYNPKDDKFYFIEFTPRVSIPSPEFMFKVMINRVSDFYKQLCGYEEFDINNINHSKPYIGLTIYPYGHPLEEGIKYYENKQGIIVFEDLPKENTIMLHCKYPNWKHKYIEHYFRDRIVVIASEMDIDNPQNSYAYKIVRNMSGPYITYRPDVGYKFDYVKINEIFLKK